MMITPDSPFLSHPRISRGRFAHVLTERADPAVLSERNLGEYWNAIAAGGVDPLLVLAIFQHESTMGRFGTARQTHSWGNTRAPSFGAIPIGEVPGRTGTFPVFKDWLDGAMSTAERLATLDWVYSGPSKHPKTGKVYPPRTTIREIFDHPSTLVWAPAGDLNDPAGYLRTVIDFMNRYSDQEGGEEPMSEFEMPAGINGIPVRKSFIPATNRNRPGSPANAEGRQWITVHETANPTAGANAEMHRRFTHGGGGAGGDNDGVSFTFVVDDHEIVWLLPLEEKSWQASDGGDGPGNSSASIEACVNVDGVWVKTKENLAQLVAFLATNAPGRSLGRIAQHNKWARDHKNCPTRLRANNGAEWNGLLDRVLEIAGTLPAPPDGADPVTGKWIASEFRAYYDGRGGLDIFGRPVTGAFLEDDRLVQYFERMEMQHFPENAGTPYEVLLRRLGAEELARRYGGNPPA